MIQNTTALGKAKTRQLRSQLLSIPLLALVVAFSAFLRSQPTTRHSGAKPCHKRKPPIF